MGTRATTSRSTSTSRKHKQTQLEKQPEEEADAQAQAQAEAQTDATRETTRRRSRRTSTSTRSTGKAHAQPSTQSTSTRKSTKKIPTLTAQTPDDTQQPKLAHRRSFLGGFYKEHSPLQLQKHQRAYVLGGVGMVQGRGTGAGPCTWQTKEKDEGRTYRTKDEEKEERKENE